MTRKIVIATTNKGKAAELVAMLGAFDADVDWLTLADFGEMPEVAEDGLTFAENARKKALGYARATGHWTLADDSGLVIDALGGAPGVHSARFSDPLKSNAGRELLDHRNMAKVLDLMKDVPDEDRAAQFVCSLCLASPGGVLIETEGRLAGRIARAERGGGGFGYDPIFEVKGTGKTYSEMTLEEKNSLSHRYLAFKKMGDIIASL